jgi:MFS family permease
MQPSEAATATIDQPANPDVQRSVWRDRRFVIFGAGNLCNNVGDAIYAIALPLLIYDLTHSLLAMSVLAAQTPATLLLGPLFGALADRLGPRALVVPGLTVQLAAALALNLVLTSGRPPFAILFVLGALVQVGGAAYRLGWMTGVPAMFPDQAVRARGTLSSLYVGSTILGPMILGATVGWLGYVGLLWVNLATFGAPIMVWLLGIHPPARDLAVPGRARFRIGRETAEGWRMIRRTPRVLRFIVMMLPLDFVASAGTVTLAMFYLRSHWHIAAGDVGLIFTVVSIGALGGSLAVSERARFRLRPVLAIASVGMAASLLAMSLPGLGLFVIALALFFALDSALAVTSDMILIKYMPLQAIGRTAGISRLMHGVPLVAAPLTIPFIVGLIGVRPTFLVLGVIALASVALLLRHWVLWTDAPSGNQDDSGGDRRQTPLPALAAPEQVLSTTFADAKESLCVP